MRIFYHLSDYISHRRAGIAYIACLRELGHELTDNPSMADVIVLHDEPHFYHNFFASEKRQKQAKYIGYAVCETLTLPDAFINGLKLVDTVWTCSAFSCQAFAPHIRVNCLPHVAERQEVATDDLRWMADRLGMGQISKEKRAVYFYTIVDTLNPRKGFKTLLAAFGRAFPPQSQNVRLVVKQYRKALDLSALPWVIDIPEFLDDGKIAALHALCDVYVSAHHAEAWGLPLSEAMSFGNPVIATGYSGNMEFMTTTNSFPITYKESPVPAEMCQSLPNLFTPAMTWADIDFASLVRTMRQLARHPVDMQGRAGIASSMARFSAKAISKHLQDLLNAL